ncbi:hypothetical protein Tco_0462366 [Tanacetum coccineum]
MRKKVNSGYVVENVLMGYGGAFVRNVANKKYTKYKEITLCKGMRVGMWVLLWEGLCEGRFMLGEGLKMIRMKLMMFKMKSKD